MVIRRILGQISNYQVYETLTLGPILHIVIGTLIAVFLRKLHYSWTTVFSVIIITCLVKESIDAFAITATFQEAILDSLLTIGLPLIYYWYKNLNQAKSTSKIPSYR